MSDNTKIDITVRLEKNIYLKIDALSKKIGVPKHSLINIILFNFLKNEKELSL